MRSISKKSLCIDLTRRQAMLVAPIAAALVITGTRLGYSETSGTFLKGARIRAAIGNDSWFRELNSYVCRLALGRPLGDTPEKVWARVIQLTHKRFASGSGSSGRGGANEWKTKKIATVTILCLREHFPSLDTPENRDDVRRLLLSRGDNGPTTAPSLLLGKTPLQKGGGTANMRLVHAVCGLLVARWLGDNDEELYAQRWLQEYLALRKASFGLEHLSSYQCIYDEMFCLLHQYLPRDHALFDSVRQVLDWHALSYAAHGTDGWIRAANLRDKRSAPHVIVPHLLFHHEMSFHPSLDTRTILFGLRDGTGGFLVRPAIDKDARDARLVLATELLANDPPSSTELNPSWTRFLFRYRGQTMTTIVSNSEDINQNPLRLSNDDTFLNPRLFKIAIVRSGQLLEAYATHAGTGVKQLGGRQKVWSSHFEKRQQFRNVYMSVGNLIHGNDYLVGPLPHTLADEAETIRSEWWVVRWGDTLLAIWTSNGMSLRQTNLLWGPDTGSDAEESAYSDSVFIWSDKNKKCASVWALFHVDQVKNVGGLKALLDKHASISWSPKDLILRARMPVVDPEDLGQLRVTDLKLEYNQSSRMNAVDPLKTPGHYEFH